MATKKTKRTAKKMKDLPATSLDARHAKGVRGGSHKHIGQPKYEDISITSGIGKTTP